MKEKKGPLKNQGLDPSHSEKRKRNFNISDKIGVTAAEEDLPLEVTGKILMNMEKDSNESIYLFHSH